MAREKPSRRTARGAKTSAGRREPAAPGKAAPKPAAKADGRKPKRAAPQPGPVGRAVRWLVLGVFGWVWAFVWRAGAVAALLLAAAVAWFHADLPEVDALYDGRATGSVTFLDRNGSVFAWRGEQYGGDLRAGEASPHLVHAVIAAEDRRFWNHWGIDPRGIARAMAANMRAGRIVQGGSTLTQQVAKNVFLTAERSLERKLKEVPMALALELKYSKEEILSIYLNRVYLGAGTYGFEAAAKRYFGTSARVVTPAQAAMLAGLLRAPSRYAPTANIGLAQGRASVIVRLMHEQDFLSEAQVYEALSNPAELASAARADRGDAFADWVMETAPSYLGRRTSEDVVMATTFDAKAQEAAEAAVAEIFEEKVKEGSTAQAAVVVLAPDGAVRAMVGGRGDRAGHFNRAAQAKRQTGSAFKPVVYAAGLEAGLTPSTVMRDAPITIGGWSPKNYGGGHRGAVTLEEALARSINTVAVRVSEHAGRERVRELARAMGISTPLAPGPAVALGTSEATLVDMGGVYATILAEGRVTEPYGLRALRLRGEDEPLMRHRPSAERAVSETTARRLVHMMHRVVEAGTGARAQLAGWDVAGKTGTTQEARDAWFIGFTSAYVIGVWMGYDDNTPLTGVTGGGLPAEIWQRAAARLHDGLAPQPLPMEAGPARSAPAATAGRRGGGDAETAQASDSLVERVFSDVLEGLGGGGGGRESGDLERMIERSGNDR